MSLFYKFNQSARTEKVKIKWCSDKHTIPAGTPMSRTGIANDGSAIGILANEEKVFASKPLTKDKDHVFEIITGGIVNLTEVEKASGLTLTDEAKSAMAGITFIDEESPSFGGGTPHWNDIEGKPFGETVENVKITYDGDTTGLESVPLEGMGAFYKISDIVPRKEELIGGTFFIPGAFDEVNIDKITVENLIDFTGGYCIGTELCVVINEYNSSDFYGCKFTSNGVWVAIADKTPIPSCELKYTSATIQTLDPKYLPSGGGAFVVNVSNMSEPDEVGIMTFETDKTFEEIETAIKNRNDVFAVYSLSNEELEHTHVIPLTDYRKFKQGSEDMIKFVKTEFILGVLTSYVFEMNKMTGNVAEMHTRFIE